MNKFLVTLLLDGKQIEREIEAAAARVENGALLFYQNARIGITQSVSAAFASGSWLHFAAKDEE